MSKKKMMTFVWLILTAILAVWVSNSAIHLKNLLHMKEQKKSLVRERAELMTENKRLEAYVDEIRQYDYMKERIARLTLGLKRKDEIIFKFKNGVDK
ncbi:MAG TPA: septum formation initiator family protein [Candidatus Mcinerneyibacteriales bacterium]|nr:septum formation initiator family protein [Candidatus Mcinerneyibacteriales bacterium]HPE29198.1 septum formation initiator family protein [Candidatus Mcinerneyibacteriales bacterium]